MVPSAKGAEISALGAAAGAASGAADEWFPLLADDDRFDPRSVIDMSALVPGPAGQEGFLKARGDKLQFEKICKKLFIPLSKHEIS